MMSQSWSDAAKIDRATAVLQGLLFALGKETHRTKLVKLTYLLDEAYFRLRGHTMTGLEYVCEHYGPNSVDDAIVRALDEMAESGAATRSKRMTPFNAPAYGYRIAPDCDPVELPLSGDDWIEIHTAVYKYGGMNSNDIVRAAKSTAPFRTARQYERLAFIQDPPLTPEEIAADPFWQETLASISSSAKRITLEELRERCA